MKKYATLISTILILFSLFAACTNRTVSDNITETSFQSATSVRVTPLPETKSRPTVRIDYPKYKDVSSDINQIIKEVALQRPWLGVEENDETTIEIDYKTKLNNKNYLSVSFEGWSYAQNTAYPNGQFFALTFDKKRNKELEIEDVIIVNDVFSELAWKQLKSQIDEERFNAIQDYLQQMNPHFDSYGFYLTANSLGIILPLIHALGDYAKFEIPYAVLDNLLKIEVNE
jgi:hypothetical protein